MKKLAFTVAAVAAISSAPAFAADLRVGPTRAPAYVAAPIITWNGFYIGGQVGYQWGTLRQSEFFPGGIATGFAQNWSADGIVGGGHVGYNFQSGQFVFGVEGDFEGSGVRGNANGAIIGVGTAFENRWQASIRGRLGVAWGNALLYATGGVAFADLQSRYFIPGFAALGGDTFNETRTGWTVGAGAEWKFAPAWSTRVEYRYTDFGSFNNVAPASFPGFDYHNRADFHAVRFGVSYHFGGGPIVAAY